jgi:hypothetical protein
LVGCTADILSLDVLDISLDWPPALDNAAVSEDQKPEGTTALPQTMAGGGGAK